MIIAKLSPAQSNFNSGGKTEDKSQKDQVVIASKPYKPMCEPLH